MNRSNILQALDTEISRLQQARTLLADAPDVLPEAKRVKRGPGRPKGSTNASKASSSSQVQKRTTSPEGKARIAAAQKARWAKVHRAAQAKTAAKKKSPQFTKRIVGRTSSKKAAAKKVVTPNTEAPAS